MALIHLNGEMYQVKSGLGRTRQWPCGKHFCHTFEKKYWQGRLVEGVGSFLCFFCMFCSRCFSGVCGGGKQGWFLYRICYRCWLHWEYFAGWRGQELMRAGHPIWLKVKKGPSMQAQPVEVTWKKVIWESLMINYAVVSLMILSCWIFLFGRKGGTKII